MRQSVHLTDLQRAVIIGTLLGDGSLVETVSKNNLRLQIDHCAAQKEYVFWKYEVLKPLVLSSPAYKSINKSWRFRTISHPELTEIGKIFYRHRQKIVPKEITSLLRPIGLAVWFMAFIKPHCIMTSPVGAFISKRIRKNVSERQFCRLCFL